MEDLTGKISQILGDPQAMEQIMSLKNLILPDISDKPQEQPSCEQKPQMPVFSDDSMQTIMKIVPLLSNIKQEDDTTRLLRALRPFLSADRQQKLDEASKILQLIKILPIIKQLNFWC